MSSQSNTAAQLQNVPQVSTFQFDHETIGKLKNSVNLYRGSVNLPLTLVSMPGQKDLDVSLDVTYSGNVRKQVETWNQDAPTGILGLGWNFFTDRIVVNKNGSGNAYSDEYYLISQGSANRLIQSGTDLNGNPTFQTWRFEFWDITYFPSDERWEVRKEGGTLFVFGDKNSGRSTVEYGVCWGNWMGNSANVLGQEQYASGWRLAEQQNVYGASVTYGYNQVQVAVGSDAGAESYTQASYLSTIEDSVGRTLTFHYGEKYGAQNPSPQGILEYQAEHNNVPAPNAYQDHFETRYLDKVVLTGSSGKEVLSLFFDYDFVNVGGSSDPTHDLMYKRVLTRIFQVAADGKELPGFEFAYFGNAGDIAPGSIRSVTFPYGGSVEYAYQNQALTTSRDVEISSPLNGATPRVWHGPDYTVITWYDSASQEMEVQIHSWSGSWTHATLSPNTGGTGNFTGVEIDLSTLNVYAQEEFIALYFKDSSSNSMQLYLYRRNYENYGNFDLSRGPLFFSLSQDARPTGFVGGDSWVMLYNKDFTGQPYNGFQWNWKKGIWDDMTQLPSFSDANSADFVVVTGMQNYYLSCAYTLGSGLAKYEIFYHDGENFWKQGSNWSDSFDVFNDPNQPESFPFVFNPTPAFVSATFVSNIDQSQVDYEIRVYQWDETFFILSPGNPISRSYQSPIVNQESQFQVLSTFFDGQFLANNPHLLRYVGGPGSSTNPQSWIEQNFQTNSADGYQFAFGSDTGLMADTLSGSTANSYLQFNPNYPNSGGWQGPTSLGIGGEGLAVSGNWMVVDEKVYFLNNKGQWVQKPNTLNSMGVPQSLQLRAPNYLAYQDNQSSNAQTYISFLQNGQNTASQVLPIAGNGLSQKMYVEQDTPMPGTYLAGPDTLVTYPGDQDFNQASRLSLFKIVDQQAVDRVEVAVVASIEIADAFTPSADFVQSYNYQGSSQSVISYDAANSLAQFPQVQVLPNTKSPGSTSYPNGSVTYFFSNGVSPQPGLQYPVGWAYNYNQLLNGSLLSKETFDSGGKLVAQETNFWELFQVAPNGTDQLYAGYFRLTKTLNLQDGIKKTISSSYFEDIGQLKSTEYNYYDSEGKLQTIRIDKSYAIQQSVYASAMKAKHWLTAQVMEVTSSTDVSAQTVEYLSSKAITYQNWKSGSDWFWAPEQIYQWEAAGGSTAPSFDFNPSGNRDQWLLLTDVVSRDLNTANITESNNVDGMPSSYIYDQDGINQLANVTNASLAADELSYYSFEPYEAPGPWQINAGASIIPNDSFQTVDANTGTSSLRLEANAAMGALSASFSPTRTGDNTFVLSCFAKTPQGFDATQGRASLQVSFEQGGSPVGTPEHLYFDNTGGEWQYFFLILDISNLGNGNGGITLQIEAGNANTLSYFLLDNLRFTPLSSGFGAINLNTDFDAADAFLGSNGECRRVLFDGFQKQLASTSADDTTESLNSYYYSRSGNNNSFSAADPNQTLLANCAGGGVLNTFSRGDQWQLTWTPDAHSNWAQEGTQLRLESFEIEGSLSLAAPVAETGYATLTQVSLGAAPTGPMGWRIGTSFTVQWEVSTQQWQLLDSTGHALQTQEFERYSNLAQHNQSEVSDPMGREWLLLVSEKHILFYVDGKQVISYVSTESIGGTPILFASDSITLDYLVLSWENRVNATFLNSSANDKQSQLLFEDKISAIENIYDNMGRPAIITKSAYLSPETEKPLLAYRSDLASYDWTSGQLSGALLNIYPEDGGFPYYQRVFETSMLGRIIENAQPGAEFSVGQHTQKMAYRNNGAAISLPGGVTLPKGQYYKVTSTDQNGNTSWQLSDQRGNTIYKYSEGNGSGGSASWFQFDAQGNVLLQCTPNYFNPPANTQSQDWTIANEYSPLGRQTQTASSDGGTVNMIYDPAGRIRFRQDSEGAAQGNYQYFKYDVQGRLVEFGYETGAWDQASLENYAQTDPSWPENVLTWRKKYLYDQQGNTANLIGRLAKVQLNNGQQGEVSATEAFEYDRAGNVLQKTFNDGSVSYPANYSFNTLGDVTQIQYPESPEGDNLTIYHRFNEIGQMVGISDVGLGQSELATYSYTAYGKPETETLNASGSQPAVRSYAYNSPTWLSEIDMQIQGQQGLAFMEKLYFNAQNQGETSYYNGQLSSMEFTYATGDGSDFTDRVSFNYNGLSAIQGVNSDHYGNRQFTFDGNSNFDTVQLDSANYQYVYGTGNSLDRVQNSDGSQTFHQYQYNANGNVGEATDQDVNGNPTRHLQFSYDAGLELTTQIDNLLQGGQSLEFAYDGANQRYLKTVLEGGSACSQRLYIRGINANSLLEIETQNSGSSSQYYIFGPLGLIATKKSGQKLFLVRDHLNSTRMVLNEQSQVVASFAYEVYGQLETLFGSTADTVNYLYTGQEYDAETDLYNFRSRFYFADIGRFAAVDMARQFFSPYVYAGNNPVLFIDPSGNFSIGNFFSAIAGAIIGVVEILIGVVIDIVAGVLEVVTGGLGTAAAVGLAALSGVFYGAGTSALTYSVVGLVTNEFSWKDFGINMTIGAVVGGITGGIGQLGGIVAESATGVKAAIDAGKEVSNLAKAANFGIKAGFKVGGAVIGGETGTLLSNAAYGKPLYEGLGEAFIKGVITGGLGSALGEVKFLNPGYKAGWGGYAQRAAANIFKSEVVNVPYKVSSNLVKGKEWNDGLLNTVVSGVVGGATSGIGAKDYVKKEYKDFNDGIDQAMQDAFSQGLT